MTVILLKASALWLIILVGAIVNGGIREKVLFRAFGSFTGFIMSGLTLSAFIFIVALIAAPWYGQLRSKQWLLIGSFWLVLTLLFEFGFGHYIQDKPWSDLFEAYTFKGGNIWPFVLLTTLLAPWIAARFRGQM